MEQQTPSPKNPKQALLVSTNKNLPLLPTILTNLKKYCGIQKITVVCPEKEKPLFKTILPHCLILTDPEVCQISPKEISQYHIPSLPKRANWFLQQFLKTSYALHPSAEEEYLVWDADTIPLQPLTFKHAEKTLFTASTEYHPPYFQTIQALLEKTPLTQSYIAQHMVFHKDTLNQLLQKDSNLQFPRKVLAICAEMQSSFSEYETYAALFARTHPNHFQTIHRQWFRHGAAITRLPPSPNALNWLSKHFQFVAFEQWDTSKKQRIKGIVKLLLQITRNRLAPPDTGK
jgi:hypothetical protein